jgi:hypothetical protein
MLATVGAPPNRSDFGMLYSVVPVKPDEKVVDADHHAVLRHRQGRVVGHVAGRGGDLGALPGAHGIGGVADADADLVGGCTEAVGDPAVGVVVEQDALIARRAG